MLIVMSVKPTLTEELLKVNSALKLILAVFILEDALCVWTNLGKHSLFVWLFVSSVKTGTRRIIRPDELSSFVRLERRTTEYSLSGRIMRLMPVFTLETNNQTNNECLPKFVQTHNASSSIKTAILCNRRSVQCRSMKFELRKTALQNKLTLNGYNSNNKHEKISPF